MLILDFAGGRATGGVRCWRRSAGGTAAGEISLDPELDEFMVQSTVLTLTLLILSIAVGLLH